MSSGDDVTLSGILVGALTASAGLIAKQAGDYFLKRRFEERDMAYQAAVNLLTTIPAVAHVFESTISCKAPVKREDLIAYPSSWPIRPPSLDVTKLIGAFADAELHRELILIADRHAAYADRSAEHRKAFDWLLEHEEDDWSVGVSARERLGTLNDQRARLTVAAREVLRYSHLALAHLVIIVQQWSIWPTDRFSALTGLMRNTYRLPVSSLQSAAEYYANTSTFLRFDAQAKWTTVWHNESTFKVLKLTLAGMGPHFPKFALLEPNVRIAVPVGVRILEAHFGEILLKLNYSNDVLDDRNDYELRVL